MEDQEATTQGRRTRSRAAKSTPVKVEKATPRKTRKKVVLMEVEVSDEEDEILEGKNVEGDESGSDSVKEGPAPNKRRRVATEDKTDVKNGDAESQDVGEKIECTVDVSEKEKKADVECSKASESKMLIEESDSLNGDGVLEKQNKQKGKSETAINEKDEKSDKVEKLEKPVEMKKKTEKTVEVEKQPEKPVEVEKKAEKPVEVKKTEKPVEVEKKTDKPVKVEKNTEKPVEVERKSEKPVEVEMKAEKPAEVEKKIEKTDEVEKVIDEPVEVKNKLEKVTRAEDKSKKPSEVHQKPEKLNEKVTKTQEPAEVTEKQDEPKIIEKGDKVEEKKEGKADEKIEDKVEEKKEDKEKVVKKEVKPVKVAEVKSEDVKMKVDEKIPEVKDEKDIKTELKESVVKEEKTVDSIEKEDIKMEEGTTQEKKTIEAKPTVDPDAENISEDELPAVQVVKVPEAEEVSDEELPGPKRAELPADTEVVSEDELPSVKVEKKEGKKRKLDEAGYDPGSPTSESETPSKKTATESSTEKEKEKSPKPKKLPELDKYWKAVNDDPTDFTGWTYLLQYVDQENDMEAAREAYDAFLSHYPYCYGYWRKYADYEKRKGNKKKCEEVFERGLKAIPLSVDLWIHYLTYVKTTRTSEEEYIRSQFERALLACGLEFRSDRLWDSYIKWETEGKRLQRVTAIYDKLLSTPTQGYTTHFDSFQEHISSNPPNKVIEVDEFLALRKEVRHMLKHDITTEPGAAEKKEEASDAPPGDEESSKMTSSDEETKAIKERIVSIRRKAHKATVSAVTSRWNYEEGIKRPYFHVKPLERCQLKNWHDYLDYESEQGDRTRIIVLFERCLIACALYEEFWLKFVHYLESVKDPELQQKIRDVYERACTIHHLKKPNLHLQWAMFEEGIGNPSRAAEILVNLEKSVPNILQIAYRRINLERRRADFEKCSQLYELYINNSKNKMVSSNISIKYSRFCLKVLKDISKAQEVLKSAISKDPNNPRLYLQLIDLTLQKDDVTESEVTEIIDSFIDKDSTDPDQKVLFAQRKLEYLEDFGGDIHSVQQAYESYQKYAKLNKENAKKKEVKSETTTSAKNEKGTTQTPAQASSYGNYSSYGTAAQPAYAYSGAQQGQYNYSQYGQGDQYQYQNWQYPQGGYGGYNQWGGYGGGYSY